MDIRIIKSLLAISLKLLIRDVFVNSPVFAVKKFPPPFQLIPFFFNPHISREICGLNGQKKNKKKC